MSVQSRVQHITEVLGESMVLEAITKLAHIEGQKYLKKIERLRQELTRYERQFAMSSEDAWEQYQAGKLGDDFDIMEWMALFENLMALQSQYDRITESELS